MLSFVSGVIVFWLLVKSDNCLMVTRGFEVRSLVEDTNPAKVLVVLITLCHNADFPDHQTFSSFVSLWL